MTQEREYEIQFHTGKVLRPIRFADLPAQFKALSWLYAYRRSGYGSISRIFLQELAASRVGVRK